MHAAAKARLKEAAPAAAVSERGDAHPTLLPDKVVVGRAAGMVVPNPSAVDTAVATSIGLGLGVRFCPYRYGNNSDNRTSGLGSLSRLDWQQRVQRMRLQMRCHVPPLQVEHTDPGRCRAKVRLRLVDSAESNNIEANTDGAAHGRNMPSLAEFRDTRRRKIAAQHGELDTESDGMSGTDTITDPSATMTMS